MIVDINGDVHAAFGIYKRIKVIGTVKMESIEYCGIVEACTYLVNLATYMSSWKSHIEPMSQ
jgi:hypothetical protein